MRQRLYFFRAEDGDEITEWFPLGEEPEALNLNDKTYFLVVVGQPVKRNLWRSHLCRSLACGVKEVEKHQEFARKKGVPTEYKYNPKTRDCEPQFTSQRHMEKFARAKGCRVWD